MLYPNNLVIPAGCKVLPLWDIEEGSKKVEINAWFRDSQYKSSDFMLDNSDHAISLLFLK